MARGEEGRDAGRAQHVSNKLSGEAEQVVQARDIHATYFVVSGGSAAVGGSLNPQTLPTGPYSFTDRTELLSRLNSVATREREPGQPGIVLLRGMNGTGKTATSVHWAHSVRHRFPDGQLYVDLGGLDRRDLVDPCDVLGRFLCLLGVPAQEQPARLGDRSALFRTLTADSRLLMVLDNAPLTSAVTELLPTSRHSMVLVTSPRKLTGLSGEYGAESETLTPLTEEAGVELLGKLLGEGRVAGERDAAATLVRLCGGLPVAIRVVGGRLQKREQWRLARLVKELSDERRRLRGLSREEELPVQAACDVAYEDLPPDAARLYRLLSLHPGPDAAATPVAVPSEPPGTAVDFGIGAVTALAGISEAEAEPLLEELLDRCLIEEVGEERYSFHNLVRLHARQRTVLEEGEGDQDAAVSRVAEWYLRHVATNDYTVNPYRPTFGPLYEELRGQQLQPDTEDPHVVAAALDRLETERRNLAAVVHAAADRNWDVLAWQMCEALWNLYLTRKHYGEWIATHRRGLEAARRLGDPRAVVRVGLQLGRGLYETEQFTEAHAILGEALQAARAYGDRRSEASALEFLGRAHIDAEAYAEAISYITAARTIFEEIGRDRGMALQSHHLGRAYLGLGEHDTAVEHLTTAHELIKKVQKDRYNRGRILTSLGRAYVQSGRPADAYRPLGEALEIMRGEGRTFQETLVLETLGSAAEGTGDVAAARERFEQAVTGYARVGSPRATELRERLAVLGDGHAQAPEDHPGEGA